MPPWASVLAKHGKTSTLLSKTGRKHGKLLVGRIQNVQLCETDVTTICCGRACMPWHMRLCVHQMLVQMLVQLGSRVHAVLCYDVSNLGATLLRIYGGHAEDVQWAELGSGRSAEDRS
jgi:hypothetical protein